MGDAPLLLINASDSMEVTYMLYGDDEFEGVGDAMSLLGPVFRLPDMGKISPGIMVPKEGCSEADQALYKRLLQEGASWKEIEQAMGSDERRRRKLKPLNVDYLTIHRKTCQDPAYPEQIIKRYADPDGKLRKIPVLFASNNWLDIIPHGLRCWGVSGLKYQSNFKRVPNGYGGMDTIMVCETPAPITKGKKVYGGRGFVERGCCNPNACPEYQDGNCKFGGTINFMIPGVEGMGLWRLWTNSWYSMVAIKSVLEAVARMNRGRLAGLYHEQQCLFWLSKGAGTVSRIDTEKGQAVRTDQWLIYLQARVDPGALAMAASSAQIMDRGKKAISTLSGGCDQMEPEGHPVLPLQECTDPQADVPENYPLQSTATDTTVPGESEDEKGPSTVTRSTSAQMADEKQLSAIRKMALGLGIGVTVVDAKIAHLSRENAGEIIKRLSRKDVGDFTLNPFV